MSREDLAFKARLHTVKKVSARSIRGYEKGEYVPGSDVLGALAQATGRKIEFFYVDVAHEEVADGDPFRGSNGEAAADRRGKRRRGAGEADEVAA